MPITYNDEFVKMDEKFKDCMYKTIGPLLLGFADGADSSRQNMYTSNLKQILTFEGSNFPRIYTGMENMIGKRNKAYKQMKGNWIVKDKIYKYGENSIYSLILYNEQTDTYDIREKKPVEDLTERFGFPYNNEVMDSLEVGSFIKHDTIISKSISYDKDMNYCYGKNAKVAYVSDPSTQEDSIKIRNGWADSIICHESDTIVTSMNTNDVPLNLYGNDDYYKPIPDIGDTVKDGTICAFRRVNYEHILTSFQSKTMQTIATTDRDVVTTKDAAVWDIDVYCNNTEELPDNVFYRQIKFYHEMQCKYAETITEWCKTIKASGSKYTRNITAFKSKYQNWNNVEYPWKNKDRAFDNVVIKFKTLAKVDIRTGFKLTGRYGDKGVISKVAENVKNTLVENIMDFGDDYAKLSEDEISNMVANLVIVDDSEMMYLDDGTQVDILLNAPGAFRRLNTDQIVETDLTFAAERVRQRMLTLDTMEEKEELVFQFLDMIDTMQCSVYKKMYHSLESIVDIDGYDVRFINKMTREEFIKEIEVKGFYIKKEPFSKIRYDVLKTIYETFDWIKPYTAYVNIFGMRKRIMRPMVVGDKYILLLKQTSNKNSSFRSTGRINKCNLPQKSPDKQQNREIYARSPISISEIHNLSYAISMQTLAEYNVFMRSSPIGRKSLQRILAADGNPMDIKKLKVKSNYTNTNALILAANFKAIGIRLNFVSENKDHTIVCDQVQPYFVDGMMIIDRPTNKPFYQTLFDLKKDYINHNIIIEGYKGEADEIAWSHVFELDEAKKLPIYENMKSMIIDTNEKRSEDINMKRDRLAQGLEAEEDLNPIRKRRKKLTA